MVPVQLSLWAQWGLSLGEAGWTVQAVQRTHRGMMYRMVDQRDCTVKLIAPIVHCHCRRVLLIARQGLWTADALLGFPRKWMIIGALMEQHMSWTLGHNSSLVYLLHFSFKDAAALKVGKQSLENALSACKRKCQ